MNGPKAMSALSLFNFQLRTLIGAAHRSHSCQRLVRDADRRGDEIGVKTGRMRPGGDAYEVASYAGLASAGSMGAAAENGATECSEGLEREG
jgi:hypothetical protein